jgi:alkanesulfonate monooxygenase SsuD/methylene tetrahydromethanopterin reductase-like flavin-dependent oxidoreductase (luciferase family)
VTTVDIQFSPANTDWPTLRRAAGAAEERRYGAIWALDHLAGLPLGGTTMIDAFTLLGAFAATTERIELGTMVANVWNRRPGTLVSAIAGVAAIADRQVHLGVGAGASPASTWAAEQHAVGHAVADDLATRHRRVAEVVALADAQWRPDREERYATFPLPHPRPTVLVGANSVALSQLAGRTADGINVVWRHPRCAELIDAAREAAGERSFLVTAYASFDPDLLDPSHPERIAMRDAGVGRLVLALFDDLRQWLASPHPAT